MQIHYLPISLVHIYYMYCNLLFKLLKKKFFFLDVLKYQLEECPQDFFYDVVTENNYLSHVLKVLDINL